MKKLIVLCALALTGCASSSGIAQSGGDTFTITTTAITSFGGVAAAKGKAIKEADAHCATTGKRAEIVSDKSEATIASGTADLTFRCIAPK